jgi:hypothetical protein
VAQGDLRPVDVRDTAQGLAIYFQGSLVLAKTDNDAGVIEHLAIHAGALIGALPCPTHQDQSEDRIV